MSVCYGKILLNWSKFLSYNTSVPLTILSQYLWFNKYIKIRNNSVYFSHFSKHDNNFIGNLVDINGKHKSWDSIKYECNLTDKEKFRWLQLVQVIPKLWVEALNKDIVLSANLVIYDHNLIKNCQLCTLDKLLSKELYIVSLCSMYEKRTSQSYYEKLLETTYLNWKEIYILHLRKVFVYIRTMFWIIFSFSISYFSSLKSFHNHCVLFATLQMKRRCISSILVILQSDYGTNFNILFLSIFLFLKLHHSVPFSTTDFPINQSFSTHF